MTETLNYVTFGGEDLYDVMDLVAVFDIRKHKLNIVSYEEHEEAAKKSRTCALATTLSKVPTISVEIVPTVFFDNDKPLKRVRASGTFIYFLDDTKTFQATQATRLLELLSVGLLRQGDWLLVTSCLSPRIVHQPRFMNRYEGTYKLFYGLRSTVSLDFRVRNHVDLLVAHTFSRFQGTMTEPVGQLSAVLVRKFKYQDTRSAMGLWLYRTERATARSSKTLKDQPFEEFPHAFVKPLEEEEEVPSIFD